MQRRRLHESDVRRQRACGKLILAFCLLPLLVGCLPGLEGGSDSEPASFSESGEDAPALNRSYKTSFLPLKMPSFGSSNLQGQLMPDSGPSLFNSATVESRKPAQHSAPPGFVTTTNTTLGLEPTALPAAQALQSFYSALAALAAGKRSQPVSIVHLGGDQIVDDKFAGLLREHLVNRFGNAGRGLMLPGLYPVRGMKVDRGGQWNLASAAGDGPGPFGITGVRVSSAASDAWLRFTSTEGSFDWLDVTLMTGPGQGTAAISADGDVKLVPAKTDSTAQTSIRITAKAREITIRPQGNGPISVLSIASGTHTPGILYTNAGLPGATVSSIEKWNTDFAASDFHKLNPDLIVFEYGMREGFIDSLDAGQYEARLKAIVDQIKVWAPHASLLIVGPPDAARLPTYASSAGAQACRPLNAQEAASYAQLLSRSDERLARWHAPPRLDAVRSAMRRQAAESGAFFWDWAKYMGGSCSIHAWTASKPPLAAPDHMTLTESGNDRSARALFAELMAGFESYQGAWLAKAQTPTASAPPMQPTKVSAKKRN